jgi:hypothetical protein
MGNCQCGYKTRALAFSCPKCGRIFVEKNDCGCNRDPDRPGRAARVLGAFLVSAEGGDQAGVYCASPKPRIA